MAPSALPIPQCCPLPHDLPRAPLGVLVALWLPNQTPCVLDSKNNSSGMGLLKSAHFSDDARACSAPSVVVKQQSSPATRHAW